MDLNWHFESIKCGSRIWIGVGRKSVKCLAYRKYLASIIGSASPFSSPTTSSTTNLTYPVQPQTFVYQQPQPQPYQYQAYQPQPAYQQPYQQLTFGYQQQPADDMMMKDHDMMDMMDHGMMMKEHAAAAANALAPAPAPAPTPAPAHEPVYLGTFNKARNSLEGDIFMLDERTLYIQGFSFDGQAPDVYFWSDGVAIPYYTR